MACERCGATFTRKWRLRFCSRVCSDVGRHPSLAARFWPKVLRHEVPGAHCWEWAGSLNNQGYGQISVGGRPRLAHRVAWEHMRGEVPAGLLVCHHCDNPQCVRPSHLFLGTHHDNTHDALAKGRPVGRPRAAITAHNLLVAK